MTFDVSIDSLANIIKSLSESERETLAILLSDREQELSQREEEVEQERVTTISEAELFDE